MRANNHTRTLALLAVLALMCVLLSGCAGSKPAASGAQKAQTDNAGAATYKVTLNPAGGAWSGGAVAALLVITLGNACGGVFFPLVRGWLAK